MDCAGYPVWLSHSTLSSDWHRFVYLDTFQNEEDRPCADSGCICLCLFLTIKPCLVLIFSGKKLTFFYRLPSHRHLTCDKDVTK